jgi:arsenate reductase
MSDKPKVLFVCGHNAGKSRMGEAFMNHLAGDRYEAISAGTNPADSPNPHAVEAMAELGIQVPSTPGQTITSQMASEAVRVITMGCGIDEACPNLQVPVEDWALPAVDGGQEAQTRSNRDAIKSRVEALIDELDSSRIDP